MTRQSVSVFTFQLKMASSGGNQTQNFQTSAVVTQGKKMKNTCKSRKSYAF